MKYYKSKDLRTLNEKINKEKENDINHTIKKEIDTKIERLVMRDSNKKGVFILLDEQTYVNKLLDFETNKNYLHNNARYCALYLNAINDMQIDSNTCTKYYDDYFKTMLSKGLHSIYKKTQKGIVSIVVCNKHNIDSFKSLFLIYLLENLLHTDDLTYIVRLNQALSAIFAIPKYRTVVTQHPAWLLALGINKLRSNDSYENMLNVKFFMRYITFNTQLKFFKLLKFMDDKDVDIHLLVEMVQTITSNHYLDNDFFTLSKEPIVNTLMLLETNKYLKEHYPDNIDVIK